MILKINFTLLVAMILTCTTLLTFVALTRTGRFNAEFPNQFNLQTDWTR